MRELFSAPESREMHVFPLLCQSQKNTFKIDGRKVHVNKVKEPLSKV